MAELVDAADSKSVFERSGSSILPRGTILKKDLEIQGLFFRLSKSGRPRTQCSARSAKKLPFAESEFRLNLPFKQADRDIDQSHGHMKPPIAIPTKDPSCADDRAACASLGNPFNVWRRWRRSDAVPIWRFGKALLLFKRIRCLCE